MLFTAHRSDFNGALSAVVGAIETRNTIPILSNVLIRPRGNEAIEIKATNLDIEMSAPCPATFESPFKAFTVTGKMLADIAKRLPESVEMSFDGDVDRQVVIRGGRARFTLMTLPAADFPEMDAGALPHRIELSAGGLTNLVSTVAFAISNEETQPYLNGIYLHNAEGRLAGVATDGHRLALRKLGACPEFPGVIIPSATVGLVGKAAGKLKPETPVTIDLSDSRMVFDLSGTRIASKLVDGVFPDYPRVIPRGNENIHRVAVAELGAAIDRVSVVTGERGKTVRMHWGGEAVTLSVDNPDTGQSEDHVAAEIVEGKEVEILFNARYALDATAHLGTKMADFALADGQTPAVVTPTGDDTTLFVLMPMRF